jgi:molybdopterin-binding protein
VNIKKISARNILKGTVKKIMEGAVNIEVILILPNGLKIISVINKSSLKNLELKEGKEVYAVIKARNVMIAVND